MKDLSLSKKYAILALDGQDSLHSSMAKSAAVRGIAAAKVLEEAMDEKDEAIQSAKELKKKEGKQIESKMADELEAEGLLSEGPDILGCDINYYTSGVELEAYKSEENTYLEIKENLRREILGDGDVSIDCATLLWLLRESGCIHDLFSISEQNRVEERMTGIASTDERYRKLWEAQFHNSLESFAGHFLRAKNNLFKNPYLEGVNLIFPFVERRKAIFIDAVVFRTTVEERRAAVIEFLTKMGHEVEEVKLGSETRLKIENAYYRIFPMTKRYGGIPVQGVYLVPAYY